MISMVVVALLGEEVVVSEALVEEALAGAVPEAVGNRQKCEGSFFKSK
jgi:hypothetical protein